ncbi:glycosyltransferase family 2 protein [Tropicimonas isoalkanivorans]|uniref:Glycosyltransferase involved in cell wall bisynthesis n=1 Tax=Tropicimonas isoalkanivorans TaxID=441112 RepID=A0A1I1GCJ4_9RHOB|nr:glycosyltransferase family A protein [Tropicimonas isoalkanivorans]SFC09469.1 Glycosyltransferase involved in cell wall bisynthesis [Tropicimonas isoalkanivorans]
MPVFTVVIPFYNAGWSLPATLASLSAQSFTDWEAICVDDGSTDASNALIERISRADPRIRCVANPGKGPSAARNFAALTRARGRYIAFLDADDIWSTEKLAVTAAALRTATVDASFSRVAFFEREQADARAISRVPSGPLTVSDLLGENPVCTMSNLTVQRDLFAATGGFNEALVHNEDLEWLIRFVGAGHRLRGIDRVLTYYRANTRGLSADLAKMRSGRAAALATARSLGATPSRRHEAVHLRYLARRALRLQSGRFLPLRLTLAGLRQSPSGFFSEFRRGGLTALASVIDPLVPEPLARRIYAR